MHTIEDSKEWQGAIKFAVIVAPFTPIFVMSFFIYVYLNNRLEIHPVFSVIVAIIPAILLFIAIWKSRIARYIYFGLETIAATLSVFWVLRPRSDMIWAAFGAIIVFIVGAVITQFVANFGFEKQSVP